MTRANTEFGQRIGTACSAIFASVALLCAAVAAFVVSERASFMTGPKETAVFLGLPLLVGAGALVATRLAVEHKLRILVLGFSTTISLFAAELYLVALESYRVSVEAHELEVAADEARRAWKDYDERSTRQFFADHWKQGTKVYPRIYQLSSRTVPLEGLSVFPTSNLSDRLIVECFSDGRYKVYLSDEYGFANPRGSHARRADVVLVGDSFTAGECVSSEEDIAARLRAEGVAALNLGIGGAGPLWELANLVEYGLPLQPRVVFWLYYEGNDLTDLMWENRFPELTRYLASHDAVLRPDKAAVDTRVAALQTAEIESLREIKATAPAERRVLEGILRSLKLSRLRTELGLGRDGSREENERIDTLGRVIDRARTLVERQGGEFVLVYVPDYTRFTNGSVSFDRERVLERLARNGVSVLDLLPALSAHSDVLALYPHRRMGHFNAAGYAFIADRLRAELARD